MKDELYDDTEEIDEMPEELGEDTLSLLKKMQKQLSFLEHKLDMLLGRQEMKRPASDNADTYGERPAFRKRPFGRPQRSFDRPDRSDRFDRSDRPPRRDREDRNFGEDRRPRENSFSRENRYERRGGPGRKREGGPRPGGARKKPFFNKYKD